MAADSNGGNSGGRDGAGRFARGNAHAFKAGESGNPGGRPTLPDWFRAKGDDALRVLVAVMEGERFDEKVSPAQAAQLIVERIYGKPTAAIEADAREVSPAALALLEMARESRE
jgi:hypothetical protein